MCRPRPAIRTACPGDEEMLSRLIRQSFKDVARRFGLTLQNCPKHPSNCSAQWLKNDFLRGVSYYILELEGQPAGCAAFELADPGLGYLERLAVLPPFRCNGYGLCLVDHVFAAAKARGAKYLSIGIIAGQTELKHWYQKVGFVEDETRTFEHLPFAVTFMSCASNSR